MPDVSRIMQDKHLRALIVVAAATMHDGLPPPGTALRETAALAQRTFNIAIRAIQVNLYSKRVHRHLESKIQQLLESKAVVEAHSGQSVLAPAHHSTTDEPTLTPGLALLTQVLTGSAGLLYHPDPADLGYVV